MNSHVQHVLTSAIGMLPGLAAVVFVHWRWDRPMTLLRFAIAYVVALVIITLVSLGSEVYTIRCPSDPREWCEYNDSTPAMFAIAAGFVLVAWIRSWILNGER